MNIVQSNASLLSPELIAKFRAIVGDKYAVTDQADIAPYVTEERDLFHGRSPLVLRPASTAEVAGICKLANEHRIALVPQGSMNSLNPVLRIGGQIKDALAEHGLPLTGGEAERRIAALLAEVGLPETVARMYPHELSGGMKQRACIAIAICLRPKVIIADEPTSALDVVVQRQVMATLARVQQELGAAVILVGHDMGLMAQFVDRLAIMYAGRLVEVAPIAEMITRPRHPYTRALIASLPSLDTRGALAGIPGLAPLLRDLPDGCAFHPRCTLAVGRCRTEKPKLRDIDGAQVACHLA